MKRILGIMLVLIAGLVLVGCGDKDVELNTVSMFGGTDANKDVYKSLINQVQASGIKVKDNSSTSDEEWKSTIIAGFASGQEADVLHFFTGETAKPLVDNNKVVSIAEIRKEYPNYAKNINASVLGTHSVPTTGFVEGLFTNKDHFKTDASKAYLDKEAMSWSEFKALLVLLVEENKDIENYKPISYGMDIPHYWLDHLVAAELGVNYYDGITSAGGDAKMYSALTKLNEINDFLSKDEEYALSEQRFFDGKSTFILDGSWFAGRVELKNATAIPFPVISADIGSPLLAGFTTGFYITKKAWDNPKKREAAVKFIETMTSEDALRLFAANGGFAADDNAIPSSSSPLNTALGLLVNRAKFQALPMGDASKTGTYAGLVTAQASFLLKQEAQAKEAIKAYIAGQK